MLCTYEPKKNLRPCKIKTDLVCCVFRPSSVRGFLVFRNFFPDIFAQVGAHVIFVFIVPATKVFFQLQLLLWSVLKSHRKTKWNIKHITRRCTVNKMLRGRTAKYLNLVSLCSVNIPARRTLITKVSTSSHPPTVDFGQDGQLLFKTTYRSNAIPFAKPPRK